MLGLNSLRAAFALIGLSLVGCHHEPAASADGQTTAASEDPPKVGAVPPEAAAQSLAAATDEALGRPVLPGASASEPSNGKESPSALSDAAAPDPQNRSKPPIESEDLTDRARHLFLAIARDEVSQADDFFFPQSPFVPLKDVADPARYFDQLIATYRRDISHLHAQRKDWTNTRFVSFELGSTPTWVAPGKEYNKIGYYRTFHGKLRYQVGDRDAGRSLEIDVGTIISWDGRWWVTHLEPIRH